MKSLNKFYVSLITVLWSALSASAQVPNITSSATPADVEEGSPSASPFSYTITADNAPLAYTAANLPSWATLTGDTIEGTPQAGDVGTVEFEVYAVNADGPSAPFNVSFSVLPAGGSAPSVSPSPLPPQTGFVGNPFSYTIPFSGTPPDTVNVYYLSGFPGLTYNASLQIIEGTPTSSGPGTVIIFAENGFGSSAFSLEINILGNVPTLPSGSTYTGEQDSDFSYQIDATNSPTSYSVTGLEQIPGLQLDSTGLITGTPEKFGIFELQVYASNSEGQSAAQTLTLTINKPGGSLPIPEITSSLSILGYVGVSLPTYTILADGNPTGYSSGILPSGLSLNASGEISGIPTVAGTYFVEIGATNGAGSDSKVLEIEIRSGDAPTVSIRSPENGDSLTAGETVIIDVQAEDADGQIVSVEISDIVSGTPVSLGFAQRTGVSGLFELNYPNTVGDQGQVILVAEAEDNDGNSTTSEEVSFSLFSGAVPTVSIDSPLNGDDFFINTSIPLAITANDGDDSVVSVEVFSNGGSVGFAYLTVGATDDATGIYTGAYEFTLTQTADAGLQRLTAVATDELGNSTTSSEVNILLSSGASPVTAINEVNGAVLGEVSVDALIAGVQYEIVTEGTGTDFATLGAANSNVGTTFTSDGTAGTGTGTVRVSGAIPADLGRVVTLEISASDSDGNVSQVEVFNGVNSIGLASLVGVDTYRFDYHASSPGQLNLQVRSTDDLGNIGFSDLVPVSVVTGAIPTATINNLTPGDSIKSGETLKVTVTATDTAPGFITSVEVFDNDVSLGLARPTGTADEYSLSIPTSVANLGTLNLQARAVDNQGNVGYSAVIDHSVVQGAVPTVSIDSPSDGGSIKSGETLKVTVTATDTAPGFITSVEVFDNDVSLGLARPTGTADEYSLSIPTSVANLGTLNLQARAVDNQGNVGYSAVIDHSVVQGAVPTVSINDPLNGEVFLINTPIPLAITANPGDESIVTVEVFDAGGSDSGGSLGFASSLGGNQYEFTLTDTGNAGLKRLTAVATDELGNSTTSDEVNVILTSGVSPVTVLNTINGAVPAVAPAVDVVDRGSIVTLEISASDSDGNVTQVEVFNGANSIGLASLVGVDTYRFDYHASSPGQLNLQVRSTDDLGNIGFSDLVPVSVVTGAIPTATINNLTPGDSIKSGETLKVTVTATDTAPGFITSVEVFDNDVSLGLARPTGTADEYSLSIPTSVANLGTLNLQARAVDNQGNVGYSAVIDHSVVQGAVPTVSIDSPSDGGSIKSGETLKVTVTATDTAPGFITSVEVFDNDVSLGLARPTGTADEYSLSIPTSVANLGTLNLQARAVDNQGNVGYSAVIDHSVVQGAVPTVSINDPLNGEVFLINTPIPLAITANPGDESIVTVEVFDAGGSDSGGSLGFASSLGGNQYEFTLTDTGNAGLKRLTAVATDELGNSTTSDEVNVILTSGVSPVTVLNTINGAVPAVAPAVDVVDRGSIVTLEISASDSDGNVTQVEVFNGANSIGLASLVGVDTYRFDYQASSPGLLNLQVRATDDLGNIGFSDLATVSVVTGVIPTVTIKSPSDGGSIKSGETLKVTVTATDTAPGFITSVEVFDNDVSLGLARPTGTADEYSLSIPTSVANLGTLNLQARAVDNQGNVGYSAVIDHSVVQGAVPTVSIDSPDNGEAFFINAPIALTITANPGDESIVTVEVFDAGGSDSGGSLGFASSLGGNQYEFTLTDTGNAGLKRLTAVATDELGNSTTSDEVNVILTSGVSPVTVLNTINGAVPAVAPAVDVVDRGSIVTLEISASDSDGNVTQVEVFNGANSIGLASLVGVDTYRFDYQASSPGLLNLQVRATDDLGNIGFSDLATVSVVTGVIPTVSIDSPDSSIAVSAYNYGDVIPFEITAYDLDGSISSVSVSYLDNGTPSELGQALSIGNDQYRFFLDSATLPTAGTKYISVVAVDDRGNTSTELVEIQLNVVPFSVEFTTPTAPPYVIKGASDEYFSAERSFTVEVGGIDASTLASLVWQKDGNSAETETLAETLDGSLTYSQTFSFDEVSNLTVTATNTDGVSVQTSLIVYVDLPSPDADRTDFIYFIYNRVRGSIPSAVELQDAIDYINALGGDTTANRATFAAELFPSDEYSNSQYQTVALVYKTLTGQWPTLTQLETGLGIISQDTTVQSRQTVSTQEGSITAGGTETLSFNYSDGDEVTITVTGDGTNANPLTDATLTVRAPDGSFVGFSDDNFLSGNFSLDPVVSFVASQTGAYTATVGGYNSLHSGDFAVTSISTAIESNTNILAARALVEALKGEYNGSNGFLADADTDSFNLAPSFVAQIYRNKHGVGITTLNSGILGQRLTGIDQDVGNGYILPGYQSDVVNFVANFALDVNLATGPIASIPTSDGYSYSGTLYYGLPNNPLSSWDQARAEIQSDANLSSALSALLGIQNPTATNLAPYAGMTLEQALASIFGSAQFAAQFVGDTTDEDTDLDGVSDYFEILLNTDPFDGTVTPTAADSFVTQRMVDLGVVDGDKVAAADDADGDGASNVAEILLNTDPSNITDLPTATGSTSTDGTSFVLEFVRLKPGLTPDGVSVVVECADATFNYEPVADLESKLSLAEDQSEISSDYERVEFRIDMSTQDCSFFRLVVD